MDAVRVLLVAAMFLGATLLDLRSRRVANLYWYPFLAFAAVLWAVDLLSLELRDVGLRAAWSLGACGLLYAFWYVGTFGGADAKGLMVAALVWPGTPDLLGATLTPAIDLLFNGTVVMLAVPLGFLLWNVAHGRFRMPAALLGVPMDLAAARARHVWPMQMIRDGALKWRFWHRPGGTLDAAYLALARHGVERVWITPKVPFMVNLLVALPITLAYGNLALRLAGALAG